MFRVLQAETNTYKYFNHIANAVDYCNKVNGKIENYLEGIIKNSNCYVSIYNKYVVVSDIFEICDTMEEAMQLKDKYVIIAPKLFAINVAKIDEKLDWMSYENPIYEELFGGSLFK